MRPSNHRPFLALLLVATLFTASRTATTQGAEQNLVTKVYLVADLIFVPPNYPYRGIRDEKSATDSDGFSGGMGGMGGGGMGGGGGFFSVPDEGTDCQMTGSMGAMGGGMGGMPSPKSPKQLVMEELADTIRRSIAPDSWNGKADSGTIIYFQDRLVVTQTEAIHKMVEELLTALRAEGALRNTITVQAWWLRLNQDDYRTLIAASAATSPVQVDRKTLETLAKEATTDQGQITCFNGQIVHIVSGRFRNAVSSAVPVVGQADVPPSMMESPFRFAAFGAGVCSEGEQSAEAGDVALCQIAQPDPTEKSSRSVGYQPVISRQHSGALLEFTPIRTPEKDTIILDLRSVVTQWSETTEKDIQFSIIPLDRTTSISQQLETTVKLPLRKPILIGGLSLEPGANTGTKTQLYLIVEVTDGAVEAPERATIQVKELK
jgi:hypothetical protein